MSYRWYADSVLCRTSSILAKPATTERSRSACTTYVGNWVRNSPRVRQREKPCKELLAPLGLLRGKAGTSACYRTNVARLSDRGSEKSDFNCASTGHNHVCRCDLP